MRRNHINRYIHVGCLAGIGMFLPLSEYMTSVFMILLSLNWLISFNARRLFEIFRNESISLLIIISFLVYLIWIFNSDDIGTALAALRLKLPLLALPVIIISNPLKNVNERKAILYSFLIGVLIASVTGFIVYSANSNALSDPREIALFISHIRLSLMLLLAASISVFCALKTRNRLELYFLLFAALCDMVFLILIFSLSGLVILCALIIFLLVKLVVGRSPKTVKIIIPLFFFVCMVVVVAFIYSESEIIFPERAEVPINYDEQTMPGNSYTHFPERRDRENGYYVWRYISYPELSAGWNLKSDINFDSLDLQGHKIKYTLIRYMSSAGLRKDSLGVTSLSAEDIRIIEDGYASNIYLNSGKVRIKLYELLWQIDYYIDGGNPQGHSLTQRIEFWRTTMRVFRRNKLFGTGSGDFRAEMGAQYEADNSMLDINHRLSTHNQYLLSLATLGVVGALLFWFGLTGPLWSSRRKNNILLQVFLIIAFLSMLWEDTLETHTGVSFFAWAYFVLLYYPPEKNI